MTSNDTKSSDSIRVMVVDDSAVVRGLITRMLEEDPGISVVASVGNGELAVKNLSRYDVDVIVLDVEMPVMDGLTALPKLLEVDPNVRIIMASTLTVRNAEISIRALESGAADYVPKPSSSRELSGGSEFRRSLIEKVKTLGTVRRARPATTRPGLVRRPAPAAPATPKPSLLSGPVSLRKPGITRPDILAIGSSTGGPQALFALLRDLKPTINVPVVITQHMPATFTTILAEHISRMTGWPCTEAKDGDPLQAGHILLAPGDYHMLIENKGAGKVARLSKAAPENFCRPAVDPMLRSVAQCYGGRAMVVILTGMGSDGMRGAQVVVDAGGTIIAQDEASSVVWGMPGAVATAGICSAVLPLKDLGQYVMKHMGRGA